VFERLFQGGLNSVFKARAADRDAYTDHSRAMLVFRSIKDALTSAEAEYFGLNKRVEDVLARAAISLGNGTDEYLTRESADTEIQNRFGREIASGQRRLEQLSDQIKAFGFLKDALMTKFPDFRLRSEEDHNSQR
jgi:hypothetical protein